ncbi:MAG: ABC-type phosphonate transport system periplasmic component [Chlorobi bacterium]|nr:ABC-type phosphonate transport system periplasmic component [Chlorobiota bacterium]
MLAGAGCAPEPEVKRQIVIGLNPSERTENVARNADILAEMIRKGMGMPVKIFVAQDYSSLVEALRSRKVDFAFFAPVSYVFAERIADARVLLKAERKGKPYYYGCIVVNADSAYRSLADLRGRDIAWVDPTSASGHLFPKAALMEAGIDPEHFFGRQTFAGGHDAVILSVINGTIAAGATFANDTNGIDGSWTQLGNGAYRTKIRPIFFSGPIPGDNLATSQFMLDHHRDIVTRLTATVQGLTADSAGKKLMQAMYHVDAMIPATSADYEPVRNAARLLKLDITGHVGADTGTSAVDVARIAERKSNGRISMIVLGVAAAAGILLLLVQTLRARRRPAVQASPAAGNGAPDRRWRFSIRGLAVTFLDDRGRPFTPIRDVNIDIAPGEFLAVIGLSGAGKSTFLRALNRMNEPSAGVMLFDGADITHISGPALTRLRREIGFIFQQFNLVRTVTVLRNVLLGRLSHVSWLPSMLGRFPREDREIAMRYIREVGLAEKMNTRADRLSGGQQQRVAIARAMAQRPKVILADEPMASLDPKLAEIVLGLLRRFNREEGITVIVSLHVLQLATEYADRIVAFRKGEIAFDGAPGMLTPEIVEEIYRTESAELEEM